MLAGCAVWMLRKKHGEGLPTQSPSFVVLDLPQSDEAVHLPYLWPPYLHVCSLLSADSERSFGTARTLTVFQPLQSLGAGAIVTSVCRSLALLLEVGRPL